LWIEYWWGEKSTELMARAAINVLEAIGEAQKYAIENGFLFTEDAQL
jgi:hypothetical protein